MNLTLRQLSDALGVSRQALQKRSIDENWNYTEQPCRGGQRRLYKLNALPADVREKLLEQTLQRATPLAQSHGPSHFFAGKPVTQRPLNDPQSVGALSHSLCGTTPTEQTLQCAAPLSRLQPVESPPPSLVQAPATPAARPTPAPITATTADNLTETARDAAVARIAILDEIRRLSEYCTINQAVKKIEQLSRANELPEHLREIAPLANAKRGDKAHLLAFRTLRRWLTLDKPGGTPSERIARLAPRTQSMSYAMPDDVGAALALYRTPNKPSLRACAQQIARERGDDWRGIYDAARRFKAKVPKQVFYGGRNTAAALKALQPFRRREFLSLAPNDVWTGDGHAMKFKIAHPETGAPFVPELTVIMDVSDRYAVGWSLSFSENCIAVSDALRWAVQQHGVPLIYYSDNGGGQKNKTFDAPVTGILGALGIRHETGIPGNPQGRGVIERAWHSVAINVARQFPTFQGHGADRDTLKMVTRDITKALRAARNGAPGAVTAMPTRLPTLAELTAALNANFDHYNNGHEHTSLPKINGRHLTPAQWRAHRLEQCASEIMMLPEAEINTLFMPAVLRKATRGEVRFINCIYYHKDLMLVDDEVVKVHYNIHDVTRVWVKKQTGELIAVAELNGNKAGYFPQPVIEIQREKRADRRVALKQSQIDEINAERTPAALLDQATGAPLVPLDITPEPERINVVALPTAERARPMFDSDAEMYQWLKQRPAEITAHDRAWIADYRTTGEYQDLFADREARDSVDDGDKESAAG